MLKQERDLKYVVYPSWAESGYAYPWKELPKLLADPLQSPHMRDLAGEFIHHPDLSNPPARLINGPVGGGIIVIDPAPAEAFNVLLQRGVANMGHGFHMYDPAYGFSTFVCYIEPYDGIGGLMQTGKRARNYPVRASAEHAEAAGGDVYWCFCIRKPEDSRKASGKIPEIARAFGLSAELDIEPDESLIQEAEPWFVGVPETKLWYKIQGTDERAGYQFAILLYAALHLKKSIRSLNWAHLVAQIEGHPNPRMTATNRILKAMQQRNISWRYK